MTDTMPGHLDATNSKKKLIQYIPDITLGTLVSLAMAVLGGLGVYNGYIEGRAADRARLAQVEKDAIENRAAVKETLKELNDKMNSMQLSVFGIKESVVILKERSDLQRNK